METLLLLFTGCIVIKMKLGLVKDHLSLMILKFSVTPAGVVILNGQLKLTSSIHSLLR